jgi:hypothetical protein
MFKRMAGALVFGNAEELYADDAMAGFNHVTQNIPCLNALVLPYALNAAPVHSLIGDFI